MTKCRTIRHNGEEWVSVEDLRRAMNDDDMILRAGAMIKVSKVEHHDSALEALRRAIAYFYTETTGAIAHHEN